MRIGSLFSGVGGLDMAVEAYFGAETVWHCEFDKHASTVLRSHYGIPNYGDITKVDWATVPSVDILTGGFPCQDLSHAGKRAGLREGTRSGLWLYMAQAIEQLRPSLVVIENVRGILSAKAHSDVEPCEVCVGDDGSAGNMRALGLVLADLADLGYDARWEGVRASEAGAPHQRFRVFIVATDTDDGRRGERLRPAERGDVLAGDGGVLREEAGQQLTLLPTPAVNDMGAGKTVEDWDAWTARMKAKHGNGNGHGKSLSIEAQRLLPTPRASDGPKGGPGMKNSRGVPDALPGVVTQLLPTPTVQDGANNGGPAQLRRNTVPLNAVQDFGPYAAAVARWEQILGRPAPSPTEPGQDDRARLSPAFTEWMMGWPEGWITGVDVPRTQQLKQCGNGVVPHQAYLALELMLGAAR